MAKKDYSDYQQDVISRYYNNMDTIMLTKLQELVTDLYLAKDGPNEDRLWERVEKAMVKLNVPQGIAQHIMAPRDVKVLATNLQDWLKSPPGK